MSKYFAIFIVLLPFSGCTTTNDYVDPKGSPENFAILKGQMKHESLAYWTAFKVEAIDEKYIPFLRLGTLYKYKLTPGTHKILLEGTFARGWGGSCPCEGRLVLTADFKAGNKYILNGRVQDNRILSWIENATTKERVSDIDEEPYVSSPKDTGYVIVL